MPASCYEYTGGRVRIDPEGVGAAERCWVERAQMAEPAATTLPPLPSPAAVLASEGSLTALVCPPDTAVHVASLDDGAAPVRASKPHTRARAVPRSSLEVERPFARRAAASVLPRARVRHARACAQRWRAVKLQIEDALLNSPARPLATGDRSAAVPLTMTLPSPFLRLNRLR